MALKKLQTTTIVLPSDFDAQKFINDLITISNMSKDYLVSCNVGKVVGIYSSARQLYRVLLNILLTEKLSDSNVDEVEQALDSFYVTSTDSELEDD